MAGRSTRAGVAAGASAAPGEFDRGWGCLKVWSLLALFPPLVSLQLFPPWPLFSSPLLSSPFFSSLLLPLLSCPLLSSPLHSSPLPRFASPLLSYSEPLPASPLLSAPPLTRSSPTPVPARRPRDCLRPCADPCVTGACRRNAGFVPLPYGRLAFSHPTHS